MAVRALDNVTLRRLAWVTVSLMTVFVLIRTTGQGGRAGIGYFYAVPIALATWWFGVRPGAVVVGICITALFIGAALGGTSANALPIALRILAFVAIWAATSVALRQAQDLRLSRTELSAVRAALTPPALPDALGIDVAAAFMPSEHGVSGDFYLLTNTADKKTLVIVGDVSGHGLESARLATFVRASLSSYAAYTSDPAEVLTLANRALAENTDFEPGFVTAVCLAFDPETSDVSWAVAGHPVPMRLPTLEDLGRPNPGLPLGVERELELTSTHDRLSADEGVLIYTDGATEARRNGQLLGAPGLRDLLSPLVAMPVAELVAQAQLAVVGYSSTELRDDLCILALRPRKAVEPA